MSTLWPTERGRHAGEVLADREEHDMSELPPSVIESRFEELEDATAEQVRLRAAPAAGGDYHYGLLLEGARPPEEETRRVLSSMVPVETG